MATVKEIAEVDKKFIDVTDCSNVLEGYVKNGIPPGVSTGWPGFDDYFRFPPTGQLNVVSGVPGSGKSEFVDSIAVHCALLEKWNVFVYSPESYPGDYYVQKLAEKIAGKQMFTSPRYFWNNHFAMTDQEREAAYSIIKSHFSIMGTGLDCESVESIVMGIKAACMKSKVRMAIIDPWNMVESAVPREMLQSDWIGKLLDQLRMFARRSSIHLWIVAHPPKMKRKPNGDYPEMSPWDISGSANFWNKADNLFILHRSFQDKTGADNITQCRIWKIKDRRYGKCGDHNFEFQPWCGRYIDAKNPSGEVSQG